MGILNKGDMIMNKERMLLLADLLDQLKPVKFNMGDWFSTYEGNEYDTASLGYVHDDSIVGDHPDDHAELRFVTNHYQQMNGYDCNSAACIAGWAVVIKHDFALDRPQEVTVGDRFLTDLSHMPVLIEACEYLGLTSQQGYDLFTKTENSVWDRHAEDLGLDKTDNFEMHDYVELSDITPKIAAKLVRMVVNGEAVLNV
jgi:hypothetical protein